MIKCKNNYKYSISNDGEGGQMKRFVTLSLIFIILCNILFSVSYAEVEYQPYKIDLIASDEVISLNIIKDGNQNILISVDDLTEYTKYWYSETTTTFYLDNQKDKERILKSVKIDLANSVIKIQGNIFDLDSYYIYKDKLYLSLHNIGPCLNLDIEVLEGKLCLVSDYYSLWELLYDYDLSSYAFNITEELYSSELTLALVLPNYIFDKFMNIVNFDLEKIISLIPGFTETCDVKDIFRDYLVLEESIGMKMENIISTYGETTNTTISSVNTLIEYAIEYGLRDYLYSKSYEFGDSTKYYLKYVQSYIDGKYLDFIGVALSLVGNAIAFENRNMDNLNSLNVVYEGSDNKYYKAAHEIIKMYSSRVETISDGIVSEVGAILISNQLGKTFSYYTAIADLCDTAFDLVGFKKTYTSMATIHYRAAMQYDGLNNFYTLTKRINGKSDINEKIRLSLIYYLNMSRDCYSTLSDYINYGDKIREIETILSHLYLNAFSTYHDCTENIGFSQKISKEKLQALNLEQGRFYDPKLEEALNAYIEFLADPSLKKYKYIRKNYDGEESTYNGELAADVFCVADIDEDGIPELIIGNVMEDLVSNINNVPSEFIVYTYSGTVNYIYYGGASYQSPYVTLHRNYISSSDVGAGMFEITFYGFKDNKANKIEFTGINVGVNSDGSNLYNYFMNDEPCNEDEYERIVEKLKGDKSEELVFQKNNKKERALNRIYNKLQ